MPEAPVDDAEMLGVVVDPAVWQKRLNVQPSQIAAFCGKWGVGQFAFFGSVVRDDFQPTSDVDVLIRLDPSREHGPWDWVEMIDELQSLFGRKVDLTSPRILENPFRRRRIEPELQVVYGR